MRKIGVMALIVVIAAGIFYHAAEALPRSKDANDLYKELELFTDAITYIRSDYVEEVETKELVYGALKGLLVSLDPYCQFMDPDTYQDIKADTEGEFGGLGIEITIRDNVLTIISPLDNTPAAQAGLLAGDKIVKIDGELTKNITLSDAVKKLRGKPGSSVSLTVLREEEQKLIDVTIIRAIITMKSIRQARILDGGIAYIRLAEFQEHTPEDLKKALGEVITESCTGLILDLRNNPGGLLSTSIDVASMFIEKDKLIVQTRGRNKDEHRDYTANMKEPYLDIPMVVMVNHGSASASEIVAGALKDYRRAIIMGTTTFGKGSVQTVLPLQDGSALRLTTSKYFTPNGISIHGEGITPDIVVDYEPLPPEAPEEDPSAVVFKKVESGDLTDEVLDDDAAEVADEDTFEIDNQIARAVDLLKGIAIYHRE